MTYAQRNDYPILSNDPLGPEQVEVHFQEGSGLYGARLSLQELDSAMRVPTYLRSLGEVNYWFAWGNVYGTYSNSLSPLDVLRHHNRRLRTAWEPFREKALAAHGMDTSPVADPDACDVCGEQWVLNLVEMTPAASASTKPLLHFLCFDCDKRR